MFSAITVVFGHGFVELEVTLWTFPVKDVLNLFVGVVLIDIFYPLFDAFEVHGDRTAGTGPNPIFSFNLL